MKRFVVDKLIALIIYITILVISPYIYDSVTAFIIEIVMIPCTIYMYKCVILLPLDLLIGPITKDVYFSGFDYSIDIVEFGTYIIDKLRFGKRKIFPEWKFYSAHEKIIVLIVPKAIEEDKIDMMEHPMVDDRVTITYYRYTKILKTYAIKEHPSK